MVTLTSYPVTISSGKVRNIFAGFSPVELGFKREDIQIVDVSMGVDNKVLISILTDITANLNIGEWVYLYSVGATFIYDGVFQIIDLDFSSPNTEITVDYDFIEVSTGGYCNYKQNWFLEAKLVSPDNTDIMVYPSLLQNDGSPSGLIELNTSMLVDFLKNDILTISQEILTSRKQCTFKYREVWREDQTQVFILFTKYPVIIIYAAENSEIEDFVCGFDMPKIWDGYPFWINLLHSTQNETGFRVRVRFDELDINKVDITNDNPIVYFDALNYGILQTNFKDNTKVIEANTRYINFNANSTGSADFETVDFDDTDFLTINTP